MKKGQGISLNILHTSSLDFQENLSPDQHQLKYICWFFSSVGLLTPPARTWLLCGLYCIDFDTSTTLSIESNHICVNGLSSVVHTFV